MHPKPQRNTWNQAENRSFARTHDGHILHTLICEYCFQATTPFEAARSLKKIDDFIQSRIDNPKKGSDILFQISANGYSHIADALNMPFAKNIRMDDSLRQQKCMDLLGVLIKSYHRAIQVDASPQSYAELLTQPNAEGYTPVHLALSHGCKPAYEILVKELKDSRSMRLMDDTTYRTQFCLPVKDNVTPLHTALRSGDSALCKAFLDDLKHAVSSGEFKRQLMQSTRAQWNVLHTATQPLESRGDFPIHGRLIYCKAHFMRRLGRNRPRKSWQIYALSEIARDIPPFTINSLSGSGVF